VWVDYEFAKANLRFYSQKFKENKEEFQSSDFHAAMVRLAHSYCTVAYSVSPKGARALLEHCLPLTSATVPFPGAGVVATNTGIDCAMCGAYGSMQAFISIPPLVLEDKALGSDRIAADGMPG
jgi:hypothetical protein